MPTIYPDIPEEIQRGPSRLKYVGLGLLALALGFGAYSCVRGHSQKEGEKHNTSAITKEYDGIVRNNISSARNSPVGENYTKLKQEFLAKKDGAGTPLSYATCDYTMPNGQVVTILFRRYQTTDGKEGAFSVLSRDKDGNGIMDCDVDLEDAVVTYIQSQRAISPETRTCKIIDGTEYPIRPKPLNKPTIEDKLYGKSSF